MHRRNKSNQGGVPPKSTLRNYRKRNFILNSFGPAVRSQSNSTRPQKADYAYVIGGGGISAQQLQAKHDWVKSNAYNPDSKGAPEGIHL